MNPYLLKLRERFADLNAGIQEIQTRAVAEAGRDLTEAELDSIKGRSAEAEKLRAEIEVLTEQETRAAAVNAMSVTLDGARKAAATTTERDPGHYRSAAEGGSHSFFADMLEARSDAHGSAATRLREHADHSRAETTGSLPGVIPPKWIAELFTSMGQQDAALWNNIAKYPLTDPRPFTLPGQTGKTTVTTQAAENDALVDGNGYNAAGATVTPVTIVGQETISRQLLDSATPGIDQLIMDDLMRSYVAQRELRIGVAIRAVGTPLVASYADFSDMDSATNAYDLVVDAAMFVRKGMFTRPTFVGMDYDAFAAILKLKDNDGRPIVSAYNPTNAGGAANLNVDGTLAGLNIAVSEGMNPVADAADMGLAVVHGPSVVGFESPGMTFRYEEKAGPQSIILGIWKYFAVATRNGTLGIKNILVDDDES